MDVVCHEHTHSTKFVDFHNFCINPIESIKWDIPKKFGYVDLFCAHRGKLISVMIEFGWVMSRAKFGCFFLHIKDNFVDKTIEKDKNEARIFMQFIKFNLPTYLKQSLTILGYVFELWKMYLTQESDWYWNVVQMHIIFLLTDNGKVIALGPKFLECCIPLKTNDCFEWHLSLIIGWDDQIPSPPLWELDK